MRKAATSVAFSPADDLLATTHVGSLGVHLWDNRATYQRLHLKPLPLDYAPPVDEDSDLPTEGLRVRAVEEIEAELNEDEGEADTPEAPCVYLSPDQLQDKMATLCGLPSTFFTAFLQIDAIKKRNAEAMNVADDTAPVQLPFFLPAIETTTGMAWLDEEAEADAAGEGEGEKLPPKRRKRQRELAVEESVLNPGNSVLNSLFGDGNPMNLLNDDTCNLLGRIGLFW